MLCSWEWREGAARRLYGRELYPPNSSNTTAPCSAPAGQSSPPRGQVSTHLSTQHLQGWGQGRWAGALEGSHNWCPSEGLSAWVLPLAIANICPGVGEEPVQWLGLHVVLVGCRRTHAWGRPLSVHPSVQESLEEAWCSQPGGDGASGSLRPGGALCSFRRRGEGELSAVGSQMMSRSSRQRRDRQ